VGTLANERFVHVVQGDYAITSETGIVLTAILGSCVAACMRDPVAGVGGMNHFLLPGERGEDSESMKYGVHSMELLINGLLQRGAIRSRIEAKLFGGAHVVRGLIDVGVKNAAFAELFLKEEGIRCIGHSLGGDRARRVRYWPLTGQASQILLAATDQSVFAEERKESAKKPAPTAGAVDLF
jgi:chemotaxis protein CheD